LAVAHLLPTLWPNLTLGGALAIVGGGLVAVGAVATLIGRMLFAAFNPPPTETVQGLKENLQWKTNK
jgi:putative superfamily III holin-X